MQGNSPISRVFIADWTRFTQTPSSYRIPSRQRHWYPSEIAWFLTFLVVRVAKGAGNLSSQLCGALSLFLQDLQGCLFQSTLYDNVSKGSLWIRHALLAHQSDSGPTPRTDENHYVEQTYSKNTRFGSAKTRPKPWNAGKLDVHVSGK